MEEDQDFDDVTCFAEQEVFELEIPVPVLPFLRGLTRIRTTGVRGEPSRPL